MPSSPRILIPHRHSDHHSDHQHHIDLSSGEVVAYLLVLALSVHSIFEGIAFGTQSTIASAWPIAVAICSHQPLAGFALGCALTRADATFRVRWICMLIFCSTTTLGAIIGIVMQETIRGATLNISSASAQAVSAGTFLFVATLEILPKELHNRSLIVLKIIALALGFGAMSAIKLFDRS